MYIEKEHLLKKINEFCEIKNLNLTYDEKYKFSTIISRELDKNRTLSYEEFQELIDHNIELEKLDIENINFNDEILEIEYIGEIESMDINVSGNHLFYANDVLTHNSATGSTEADNSNVSDSMGSVMTSDFMLFLLQTPEMKENKEIIFKITKNRYTGRTDTWIMNIDYEHMRFSDTITENSLEHTKLLEEMVNNNSNDALDFGVNVVTADKMKNAEEFAINEIKDIAKQDMEILIKDSQTTKNPLSDNTEDLLKELGIF